MPTYQYACTACDERLEAVQSFTDAPLTQCPACDGTLRKVFSAVGVVFKGSGFYKTDSRGGSSTATEGAKSETKAKSDSGSSDGASASSSTAKSGGGDSSSSSTPAASAPASKSA